MRRAVVVSYARTGLAKSGRGGFNNTHGAAMAGHAIQHAVQRAKVDPAEIEDVVLGCGIPEGATGHNIARLSAIWAGLPVTTAGTTINRFCSSGLQAIATASHYILNEGAKALVAGGVESISLVQMSGHFNSYFITEEKLMKMRPDLWMSMIDTADSRDPASMTPLPWVPSRSLITSGPSPTSRVAPQVPAARRVNAVSGMRSPMTTSEGSPKKRVTALCESTPCPVRSVLLRRPASVAARENREPAREALNAEP